MNLRKWKESRKGQGEDVRENVFMRRMCGKQSKRDRQGKEHILHISTLQLRQAICQVEYYKGVICRLHFLDNFVC